MEFNNFLLLVIWLTLLTFGKIYKTLIKPETLSKWDEKFRESFTPTLNQFNNEILFHNDIIKKKLYIVLPSILYFLLLIILPKLIIVYPMEHIPYGPNLLYGGLILSLLLISILINIHTFTNHLAPVGYKMFWKYILSYLVKFHTDFIARIYALILIGITLFAVIKAFNQL